MDDVRGPIGDRKGGASMSRHDDPPAPDLPPWGENLLREYDRRCGEFAALHQYDRPGIPADQRDRIARAKLEIYEGAAVVRAKGVNDFLTLLRWAREDAPGILESLLAPILEANDIAKLSGLARRRTG